MSQFLALWKRLISMLSRRERWLLLAVFAIAVIVAIFETMGVASVLPFMAVVMDPSVFEKYAPLRELTRILGLVSTKQKLVALGIAVGFVVVLSNAASAIGLWSQQRLAARIRTRLSSELYERFLYQPYSFHVTNDGPTLQTVLVNDIDAVGRLIASTLQFTSRICVVIALVSLLLLQNPLVAICSLVVLGGSYAVIFMAVRNRQTALGRTAVDSWSSRQRIIQESLGGIKELQVLGREHNTVSNFGRNAKILADVNASNFLLSGVPRYILEPIGFGGILAVALYMILTSDDAAASTIPTLALYAFVGYRLLPAMQQIYSAATEIKFSLPAVTKLYDYYSSTPINEYLRESTTNVAPIPRNNSVLIALDDTTFTHVGAKHPAVKSVSVNIMRGQSLGIVGKSGSGKTTLADIILGLHLPQSGVIQTPDGVLDERTVREWRKRVGYVPQNVFLANATILENVGFGLAATDIDRAEVERAVALAQADEFIAELPAGLDTVIGERGVVLSGGQRQRLGIARALYNNPEVLVFDEATSALDGMTESGVMDAIHSLTGLRTVILIAHRLQTIESCDRIIHLHAGEVVGSGTFDELLATSARFREFTNRIGPTAKASGRSLVRA